eukprot:2841740-Alexandrium_andersonii.AAC.1
MRRCRGSARLSGTARQTSIARTWPGRIGPAPILSAGSRTRSGARIAGSAPAFRTGATPCTTTGRRGRP